MSGSGNDFVVFDSRGLEAGDRPLERPEAIQALCARGTGVGADGVVFLAEPGHAGAALAMRYYNSDGSRGEFCGNATLCVTRLARGAAGERHPLEIQAAPADPAPWPGCSFGHVMRSRLH